MTFTYFIALNTTYRPFCTVKPLPLNGSHEGVMIGTSMHTSYTLWGEGVEGVPLLLAPFFEHRLLQTRDSFHLVLQFVLEQIVSCKNRKPTEYCSTNEDG